MKRTMLLVPVLVLLIMSCGLFAQQESVAIAQTATLSQGAIMIADKDVVKETTTTTEKPAIEEKRTTTTTEKPAIEEKRTTTTTEKPVIEEKGTKTKTTTETKY